MTHVPPPPRAIRPTHPIPKVIKVIGGVFFAAVCLAEVVLIVALVHEGVLRGLGYETRARLISLHERQSPDGSYTYPARYTIERPGHPARTDESALSFSAFHRLSKPFITVGGRPTDIVFPTTAPTAEEVRTAGELGAKAPQTLAVRGYDFGPISFNRPVEHESADLLVFVPLIFVPVGGLLCWALYLAGVVRPRRRRWLYTDGAAVPGTVTGGWTRRIKSSTMYHIGYQFTPAGESAPRAASHTVAGEAEYEQALSGKPVTVLYDPARPKRNVMYEYGGYAWV
ncbi:MAG TPA: DUF3592 domain-containing protein [Tepidisphaeraceae bacterium]|nr:DUF3592 domain-containing protein [Tepidisphaeraceae bacterium]